ncbi:MAG: hypothetical protein D6733_00560 [Methanobacteriota archaeon]|nr:MAG: hypothetical protein D6733_00560 [Euryarchaeota archaeon]
MKEAVKGQAEGSVEEERKDGRGSEAPAKKLNKKLVAGGALGLVILFAALYIYGGALPDGEKEVNAAGMRDIGAVRVWGDGMPGYDIDRDGRADYLSEGFGYYKELYNGGGFQYRAGKMELKEFSINLTLPELSFRPDDIVESGVGSVVSFTAENSSQNVEATVIYKTLGPSLDTYNLIVRYSDGKTYRFIDVISEEGGGTIENEEVEIAGHVAFRE